MLTKRNIARTLIATTAIGAMTAGAAYASVNATASTDLNLRAGPAPHFEVIDVIAAADQAVIMGCMEEAKWCEVTYEGQTGWAYSDYLNVPVNGVVVPLTPARAELEVKTVTYNEGEKAEGAVVGGSLGAAAGALVFGGPVAVGTGLLLGGAIGFDAAPDPVTITYIEANPVDPVYLEGEVVLGAGIPEGVELAEVPDNGSAYANVNGQLVVVNPEDRRITHILR